MERIYVAKRESTQTKDGTSNKRICPKCGKGTLRRNHKTPAGKTRWICRETTGDRRTCYTTVNPDGPYVDQAGNAKPADRNPQFRRPLGGIKRFLITTAQNATPVHEGFWRAMEGYCKHTGAELVVIPIRYKNPTSRWTESQRGEEFWQVPKDALYNQRKKLCENLVLLGDVKTTPTRERPLTGLEGMSHGESAVIGHPKLQLLTVPTPQYRFPKILTTTGACTIPNYTDSQAGKKGEFHHTLGACVVEVEGKQFHMRQANACTDGSFIDGKTEYLPDGTWREAPPALGLVMGDTHARFADPQVMEATFGPRGIVDWLNPDCLVWHDLFDGYSCNPHHREDPYIALAKYRAGYHDVRDEVQFTIDFLEKYTAARKSIVVASNHNDMLNRFMRTHDWRKDPVNADFYLETAKLMADAAAMTPHGASTLDPFAHWVEQANVKSDITCLKLDESFRLGDIEIGFHGDHGPNGARGTVNNLRRLGVRLITGHGHSPAIEEGHYRTGTSTPLKLEYTHGPGSWMNTHCVVYANSKRTLINILDGRFRL
jgi:ribosomal protein S27AE